MKDDSGAGGKWWVGIAVAVVGSATSVVVALIQTGYFERASRPDPPPQAVAAPSPSPPSLASSPAGTAAPGRLADRPALTVEPSEVRVEQTFEIVGSGFPGFAEVQVVDEEGEWLITSRGSVFPEHADAAGNVRFEVYADHDICRDSPLRVEALIDDESVASVTTPRCTDS